jgi:hypothetical protein
VSAAAAATAVGLDEIGNLFDSMARQKAYIKKSRGHDLNLLFTLFSL